MTHDVEAHVHDPDPPRRKSTAGQKLTRWTEEELTRLHELYNQGMTRANMARVLGMTEDRVKQRLQWEGQAGRLLEARKRRRAAQRLVTKIEQRSERMFFDKVAPGPKPAAETLRQRDARYAAPARDIAGLLFGDPPVGFSALEQRT